MIKMSRKAKKAMAVALTAGMLASTAVTPVMAATQGWKQNSKGWWYQNADGSYPANKWSLINGKWYYFDANGYMKANAWVQDKAGKWYFVGADGAMKVNSWAKDKAGLWYWLTDDGSMFTGGWGRINGEWYFFQNNGVMQSGVVKVEGETYYLGSAAEGWMHTGKVDVAGTTYNFDAKSGACTDTKAPAAAKAFDKTGKEVENKVDIEEVDGITGKITNALPDYQAEYGNVLIAGSDAYLKILVSDKDGNPVPNTPVSLTGKVNTKVSTAGFKIKGLNVQTTDANGYATFVIGADDGQFWNTPLSGAVAGVKYENVEVSPTSGHYALISLTATAVATNQEYKTDVSFATVNIGAVNVVNDDKDSGLTVEPSTNAPKDNTYFDATPITYTIDGKATTEYVSTQQVNTKNTTDHKVVFELNPQIKIPYEDTASVIDKYQQDVNQEIKEYSVYQNGGSTSFKVEGIPAGLKYATLNFSSIDISDYTRVEIQAYEAGKTDKVGDPYIIDGPLTQKNFGYQIPVQQDKALDIVVKVISEGQVDDNQNAGLVVKDVTGLYDTKVGKTTKDITLKDSVTWTTVENQYSNSKEFPSTVDPRNYIPDSIDAAGNGKYKAADNTYTYQVPVYPYTGNAIITVKDVNKKVVGYFTVPTTNIKKDGVFQNENDIVAPHGQAVLVSADEAFNTVGTITPNGNKVEVNSDATGITAVQAKINLAGFEDQINLTNNTVYTSVHWSPIPTEKKVESDDFYALVGQTITVKAQLVDNNGNKVSQSGQQITYSYDTDNKAISSLGAVGNTKATATSYTSTTDANGQATLKLASGDHQALVNLLHATSSSYNVQLTIGDTTVTNANLRWVEPGLAFTSSVDNTDKDYEKAITLASTKFGTTKVTTKTSELKNVLAKDTGSNWIFGYEVIGETQDDKNDSEVVTTSRWVDSISGLKVDITKGGAGDITTTGMDNGAAKLTSSKAGATTLTGTIDEKSVVNGTDVVFKVAIDTKNDGKDIEYKEYKNVGEGTPSIGATLNLPITWGTVGTAVNIVSPKGTSLIVDKNVGAGNDTETVYVKVADEFGNPKAGESVDVTVTYSDGTHTYNANAAGEAVHYTDGKPDNITLKDANATNSYGLVNVTLKDALSDGNGGTFTPTTATISAKVGNETTQQTIQYKTEPTSVAGFALVNASYEAQDNNSTNPKVILTFSAPVNKETLNKDMFSIASTKNVAIDKVELDTKDNKKVVITLGNQHANGLNNDSTYTVKVAPKKIDGVDYSLCDTYGRGVEASYTQISFTTVADTLNAVLGSDGKITLTVNGNPVSSATPVIGVYNSKFSGVVSGESKRIIRKTADIAASDITKQIEDVVITFYYNGSSVDVTIPALTETELGDEITSVIQNPTVAAATGDIDLSTAIDNTKGVDVTITLASTGDNILSMDGTKKIKVDLTTSPANGKKQNFTVTYKKGSVTQTKTYTVTTTQNVSAGDQYKVEVAAN